MLPFQHGPKSQCPLGAAPLQLLRKGLKSFPPMLEIPMSAGRVAGSSSGLERGLREIHPPALLFLPVLPRSGGDLPLGSAGTSITL